MTIAVDFDGTIVEHKFPAIGRPRPFAFEALRALINDGHHVILWTNREGKFLSEAVEFCRTNGVEFYAVNSESPDSVWTNNGGSRKIVADIYIDDKNLGGIPDWDMIYININTVKVDFSGKSRQRHSHNHHHHHHNRLDFFKVFVQRCKVARTEFRL